MAQVHPYKFTTTLLYLAQQRGTQIVSGRCTSLNSNSVTYMNDGGSSDIPADIIIVATGPWTPSLIPGIQMSTFRAHSIVLEPSFLLPAQRNGRSQEARARSVLSSFICIHQRPERYSDAAPGVRSVRSCEYWVQNEPV